MQMSVRPSFDNLEITGSIMEVPRAKEPTLPRPSEKRTILPIDLKKKPSSIILTTKSLVASTRSISQLSMTNKKTAITSETQKYEDEIFKLKKRIEDLELQLKTSQKSNKEKEKICEDLSKKLTSSLRQESFLVEKMEELQKQNEMLKAENDRCQFKLLMNEDDKRQSADKSREEMLNFKLEKDKELSLLKEDHSKDIRLKDEKLDLLKKQIAGAFKDNSWERQLQIDELSKELKRTQEEYDLVKHKLKGFKNKSGDTCQNCTNMHEKLEEKTLALRVNETNLADLINLMKKFQSQINFSDELLKLTGGGNRLTKLSPVVTSKAKTKK